MAGLPERIYLRSPIWLQQIAAGFYGWWWYKRRFSTYFYRLVRELTEQEFWTAEQFRNYQERQFRNVLAAAGHSPYYSQVFAEAGIKSGESTLDDLRHLPLLSKEILRTRGRELLTQNPLPKGVINFKSSGTTGTPTEIFYTREFHALELAVPEARNLYWAGVDHHERRVMFGVRKVCHFDQNKPPFWRLSPIENMAYASIYHLSPRNLPHYMDFLRTYRPAIIMGYPSALNALASFALDHNDMPYPARGIFTTSETVTTDFRKKIESVFQCPIYDRYCAVEMCLFASQCQHGRYHVSPEIGIVEIVDSKGRKTPPGEIGEVVCTGLQNTLQPLIRYRIGDVARWAIDQNCQCGRAMPILESIEGRFEDLCFTPDGREMLRFDTVFKGIDNIREAQIVQEHLNSFSINIVPAEGFQRRDIETITHNMRLHVGNVHSDVRIVPDIPRSRSGKFRAVLCNLSEEEKQRVLRIRSSHSPLN